MRRQDRRKVTTSPSVRLPTFGVADPWSPMRLEAQVNSISLWRYGSGTPVCTERRQDEQKPTLLWALTQADIAIILKDVGLDLIPLSGASAVQGATSCAESSVST